MDTIKKSIKIAAIAGASLSLTACETIGFGRHPLDGTYWRLTVVDRQGVQSSLNQDLQSRHTISFNYGGQFSMQLDCNQGSGSWSAQQPEYLDSGQRGTISISPIAATRAYCQEPTFGEQMAADLPMTRAYRISTEGDRLVLRNGATRYVFRRY